MIRLPTISTTCLVLCLLFAATGLSAQELVKEVVLPEGLTSAQTVAVDADGKVWFSEKVGRKLSLYDPETEKFSSFQLPESWGDVGFSQFTLSPAGEIWFTVTRWAEGEEEPHMLGKFTPKDGYFTRFKLSIETIPNELLVGEDGVIWFTAANKNRLYRVDPDNFSLKGYPTPSAKGYPRYPAFDQKGRIWFTEPNVNKLALFDPEKELFSEYEVPTPFANPADIAIDSKGRVWFAEVNTNRIGVYYPEWNRFDEALIPTPKSSPNSIVVDDEDNIWFLGFRSNKIGLFIPGSALFHEYGIPTFNSLPGDLAIDRTRSALWFTEGNTEAKRLGTLSIKAALALLKKEEAASQAQAAAAEELLQQTEKGTDPVLYLVSILFIGIMAGWFFFKRNGEA